MQIRFELNQRHGRGFQLRVINGPLDKLYDEEPLNMYEAGALRRFCEYIAAHGYKGGAAKALAELDALRKDDGVMWIKRAYARYAQDNNSCIQYVMGALA